MKKAIIALGVGLGVVLTLFFIKNNQRTNAISVMQSDNNVVVFADSQHNPLSSSHNELVQAIDQASEIRMVGDSFFQSGQYKEAAIKYKEAYLIDRSSRAISGMMLVRTYEMLHQYDEAITLIDKMIENKELSSRGIEKANAIKARLLISN